MYKERERERERDRSKTRGPDAAGAPKRPSPQAADAVRLRLTI